MKHLHSIYIAVTILLFSACSYNSRHLSNALKVAGDNRPELEAVLDHYKDNPEKLAAAKFLIENMPAHRSYKGDEIHQYYEIAKGVLSTPRIRYYDFKREHSGRIRISEMTALYPYNSND